MLAGLGGAIDVIVPRGGKSLVERVQEEARVPVFAHLEGVCHVYVRRGRRSRHGEEDRAQRQDAAHRRLRRGGDAARRSPRPRRRCLAPLVAMLIEAGCEVRGDAETQRADARVKPASEEDWATEYLDAIIAVKVVAGVDEAIEHIARYGSQHTDAIVTQDQDAADRFLRRVDSAIVLHNASTQFADGGEFGMGAEIGIATGRFHARGPVGARATHHLQICGARPRPDAPLSKHGSRDVPQHLKVPAAAPGMRIGLLGGSFNPAHAGHLHISRVALARLGLDQVWWLVSPGNPLKNVVQASGPRDACRGGARDCASPAHRRHRLRGRARLGLQHRHDPLSPAALSASPFRLAHGRRQSGRIPSLARLGGAVPPRADRRARPAGIPAQGPGEQGGAAFRLRGKGRIRCGRTCADGASGLDLADHSAVGALLDAACAPSPARTSPESKQGKKNRPRRRRRRAPKRRTKGPRKRPSNTSY